MGSWMVAVPLIGIDAGSFWSQMQGGVDVWADVGNGVIKSFVFGVTVSLRGTAARLCLQAHTQRCVPGHHPDRHGLVVGACTRLHAHRDDVLDLKEWVMQQSRHDVWVGLFVMIGAAAL